uniref:Uncharacterized protein n=1 Tax=Cajanus cajan TaxID=3821 RepID=A0A151U8X7_CAJCA|nr:hypothetical protein KK1_019989 [Cajanus cajan]
MAMAGMECKECAISLEEWDPRHPQKPPLYLLIECDELDNVAKEKMKAKIREWAKFVASCSKQERVTNDKCNVHGV